MRSSGSKIVDWRQPLAYTESNLHWIELMRYQQIFHVICKDFSPLLREFSKFLFDV